MLRQYENQNKKQFDSIFFSPARVKKIIEVIISVLSFIFKSHMVLQNQNTIHKFYSNKLFYMYVCLHNGQFLIPLDISHKHLTEKKKCYVALNLAQRISFFVEYTHSSFTTIFHTKHIAFFKILMYRWVSIPGTLLSRLINKLK